MLKELIDKYLYLNEDRDVCVRDNASSLIKEILEDFLYAYTYFKSDDCFDKMDDDYYNTYKTK